MTELSFLIDLLMNHKLPKATKDLIMTRIKEVEESLYKPSYVPSTRAWTQTLVNGVPQAPSTLTSLEKHGPLPAVPVEQIAQTPATAAAMQHRQETIAQALSGKVEKGATSPRKW